MNRYKLVYLVISLTITALALGSLPLAAAETSSAPAGMTETPMPTPTSTLTPMPTNTATPTATSTPTATPTPTGTPTPTATPTGTLMPTATATNTPPPTAVELRFFSINRNGRTAVLNWATAAEVNNYGFNLYRASVDNFAQAELIHFEPAAIQGGPRSGATYLYTDTPPVQGIWWYWLADVDTRGIQTRYNPSVAVAVQLYLPIYLPWIGTH